MKKRAYSFSTTRENNTERKKIIKKSIVLFTQRDSGTATYTSKKNAKGFVFSSLLVTHPSPLFFLLASAFSEGWLRCGKNKIFGSSKHYTQKNKKKVRKKTLTTFFVFFV